MRLELDSSLYAIEAVQKAAYRFIDRLTVYLSLDGTLVICELSRTPGCSTELSVLADDFKRELLDQQLRLQIKNETADVRNLVLAYAFSRTGLQE